MRGLLLARKLRLGLLAGRPMAVESLTDRRTPAHAGSLVRQAAPRPR